MCPVFNRRLPSRFGPALTAAIGATAKNLLTKKETMTKAATVRLIEIAELLGVSKQRAHQIADELGFPSPVERDGRSRLWSRREVAAWAKAWRSANPWR
jgi:predicted DNA-binding transcriptional regulator AlpA